MKISPLQFVWFSLVVVLWSGYFFLEGFDFGVGMLLRWIGRNDIERRAVINTIGPTWDGNEVWLLVAGGATFAAFPRTYATVFSSFYLALFLILVALIFRGVAFEYRSKLVNPTWRKRWDMAIFIGSLLPAVLWGVAFGDFIHGIPIDSQGNFTGNFFSLLSPYSVFVGLTMAAIFLIHGALFLEMKLDGELRERANYLARRFSPVVTVLVVAFIVWTYVTANHSGGSNIVPGIMPILIVALVIAAQILITDRHYGWAFATTGATIIAITVNMFLDLYPRVLVSSTSNAYSLTITGTASAHYTLVVMTIVAAIFTPLVLLYQGWSYRIFRARIRLTPPESLQPQQEIK